MWPSDAQFVRRVNVCVALVAEKDKAYKWVPCWDRSCDGSWGQMQIEKRHAEGYDGINTNATKG